MLKLCEKNAKSLQFFQQPERLNHLLLKTG